MAIVVIQFNKRGSPNFFDYYADRIRWLDHNKIQYKKKYHIGSQALWPDSIELEEEDAIAFKLVFGS
jgi:hypothetical protein